MRKLTYGSLFSGIGGIDLAFQAAGFDVLWQVEQDEFCQNVLQYHWPDAKLYGDIFDVEANELKAVDVISGGFPCQPFSVAGSRRGEDDERFLFPEIIRIARTVKPRVILLENVPGLLSINDGRTFKSIIWSLSEIGYAVEWQHLQAKDVGAPHKRERVFIVAYAVRSRLESVSHESSTRKAEQYTRRYSSDKALAYAKYDGSFANQDTGSNAPDVVRRTERAKPSFKLAGASSSTFGQGAFMGDTISAGRQKRNYAAIAKRARYNTGQYADVANPNGERFWKRSIAGITKKQRQHTRATNPTRRTRRTKPRLGSATDGLSRQLAEHRFPAGAGEFQHEWEAPRTVPKGTTENRNAKIKALGNAVVPQVILPIALAIREYLD